MSSLKTCLKLVGIFKNWDINILDVFYCPYKPEDNCSCRKPKPGMIQKACEKYNIDLKKLLDDWR